MLTYCPRSMYELHQSPQKILRDDQHSPVQNLIALERLAEPSASGEEPAGIPAYAFSSLHGMVAPITGSPNSGYFSWTMLRVGANSCLSGEAGLVEEWPTS